MPLFTLSSLRTKVLNRLDDNSALYTTPEIDYVINECLRVVNLFTGFYRTTTQYSGFTVANQLVYSTPSGLLVPLVIFFEGRQLQKLGFRRLTRQRRTWATDTTAGRGPVEYWAPIGIGKFVMTPKDSVGGRDLTIIGTSETPVLVNAADVMPLENEYVELITEYAAHRLPLKEGGKIFADGSLALRSFYSKMKEKKRYQKFVMPKYWLLEPKKAAAEVAL